jgi:hypothetical protein
MGAREVGHLAREGGEILDDLSRALGVTPQARLVEIVAILDVPLALHDFHAAGVANFLAGPLF